MEASSRGRWGNGSLANAATNCIVRQRFAEEILVDELEGWAPSRLCLMRRGSYAMLSNGRSTEGRQQAEERQIAGLPAWRDAWR